GARGSAAVLGPCLRLGAGRSRPRLADAAGVRAARRPALALGRALGDSVPAQAAVLALRTVGGGGAPMADRRGLRRGAGAGERARGGSLGLAGSAAQLHAWRELLEKTTPPLLCEPGNQGLAAIVCSYLVPPASPAFWPSVFALGALVALGLAVPILREAAAGERRRAEQLAFVFALYLTAALSPLGWHTTHLVAVPCLYLLAAQAWSSCAAA